MNSALSAINYSLKLQGAEIGNDFLGEMASVWWKEERVKFYSVKPICC